MPEERKKEKIIIATLIVLVVFILCVLVAIRVYKVNKGVAQPEFQVVPQGERASYADRAYITMLSYNVLDEEGISSILGVEYQDLNPYFSIPKESKILVYTVLIENTSKLFSIGLPRVAVMENSYSQNDDPYYFEAFNPDYSSSAVLPMQSKIFYLPFVVSEKDFGYNKDTWRSFGNNGADLIAGQFPYYLRMCSGSPNSSFQYPSEYLQGGSK